MQNNSEPPVFNKATITIFWIILLLCTTFIFNGILDDFKNPNKSLTISFNELGQQEVVLDMNRYGHYIASGTINNHNVDFLLDTGATLVAIPEHIANKLNLIKGRKFLSQTANGTSTSYTTTLDKLSLGGLVMTHVPASISTGMEFDEILLGMSFLKHLQLTQSARQLTITIPND
jgi:aspartyl protease family protein